MSTAVLSVDNLTFKSNAIDVALKLDASSPSTLSLFGLSDAAVRLSNVAAPTTGSDAATRTYVDNLVGSVSSAFNPKTSVAVASTTNYDVSSLQPATSIDDVLVELDDRVLLKDQTNAVENGIYVVTATGGVRAADLVATSDATSVYLFVDDGIFNNNVGFYQINKPAVVGTDELNFVAFSVNSLVAEAPLAKTGGNLSINYEPTYLEVNGSNQLAAKGFVPLTGNNANPMTGTLNMGGFSINNANIVRANTRMETPLIYVKDTLDNNNIILDGENSTITVSGDIIATNITSQTIDAQAGMTTTTLNATGAASVASLTSTGAISGTAITASGGMTTTTLNASGAASVASVTSTGAISGTAITASGGMTTTTLDASGAANVASLTSTGAISCTTITASGAANVASLVSSGTASCTDLTCNNITSAAITSSGAISATGNITSSGEIQADTLVRSLGQLMGNSANITTNASVGGNLTVTGTTTASGGLTTTTLTASGAASVASLTSTGAVSGTAVTATSITSSGSITSNGGTVTAQNISCFGGVTADGAIQSFDALIGNTLDIATNGSVTGALTTGSLTTGAANVTSLTSTGAISGTTITASSGMTAPTVTAASFTSTSDIRKKKNLVPLSDALAAVHHLSSYKFQWKDNDKATVGVIAQDVQGVYPELVEEADDEDKSLSVNYNGITAVLLQAVKELVHQVQVLSDELETMKSTPAPAPASSASSSTNQLAPSPLVRQTACTNPVTADPVEASVEHKTDARRPRRRAPAAAASKKGKL